ncbi:MAG TPA: tRNA (adenosine(37)-N6)-threonylcarbamoyltransferase complex dimerization subunit type 1 TsaB [Candidatus Acidoferrales bacterium]
MLTLSVDTSSRVGSLAVLKDQSILGVVSTSSDEAYSARMFRQLKFMLAELGIGLPAIDLYAVIAGPGSFTGLRVGLTAVKGWAEVYHRPIVPVSGLEAVAVESPVQDGLVASILDARRGQIYGALYSKKGGRMETLVSDCVSAPDEFLSSLRECVSGTTDVVIASPSPEYVRNALAGSAFAACAVLRVSPVLAPVAGLLGIERAARGEVITALELDANYVRRTDAEMHLKGS